MEIKILDLKSKLIKGLTIRGLSDIEARMIADHLVEAELMGKKTHGIGKVFMMEDAIKVRGDKPIVIKNKGNYALVDGQKELGLLSAKFSVELLINKAKEFDNAIVATVNSFYYTMAGIYARQIAKEGFVSIVLNNGGPATLTPQGGVDPIFGTNPISIGIPTSTEPIVLDMTTGEKPWGEVQLAKVEKRQLQDEVFRDKEGNFTTDPYQVVSIIPFGGYKGYGLNFMFEIMTGAFVTAKMGLQSENAYDLGFLFMAYSPEMFSTRNKFNHEVEQLVNEVKSSRRLSSVKEIFIPGEQSYIKYQTALKSGLVDIADDVYTNLNDFANGEDVSKKVGLKQ